MEIWYYSLIGGLEYWHIVYPDAPLDSTTIGIGLVGSRSRFWYWIIYKLWELTLWEIIGFHVWVISLTSTICRLFLLLYDPQTLIHYFSRDSPPIHGIWSPSLEGGLKVLAHDCIGASLSHLITLWFLFN
jgi:hypothetical protein